MAEGVEELKDRFGRALIQPPRAMPEQEARQRLRETKQAGETYEHKAKFELTGGAKSKRFATFGKEVMNVRLTSVAIVRETVISADYDTGTVTTEYSVQASRSELASGTAKFELVGISSDGVMRHIRAYGGAWEKALNIGAGASAKAALGTGDPYLAGLAAVLGLAAQGVSRAQQEVEKGVATKRLTEDCEIILKKEDLQSVPSMRGVDELSVFISKLEGVQVRTVWNSESGYIRIDVEGEHLPLDDEDMIRRMIARTDMLSVWSVLPQKAKVEPRPGDEWQIDANRLAFTLFSNGFDFEEISGGLHVVHDGYEERADMEDENLNLGAGKFRMAVVKLDAAERDKIEGKNYLPKDTERKQPRRVFAFEPKQGALKVVMDERIGSRYVREADLTGRVASYEHDARPKVLGGIEFTTEIEGRLSYLQTRFVQGAKPAGAK